MVLVLRVGEVQDGELFRSSLFNGDFCPTADAYFLLSQEAFTLQFLEAFRTIPYEAVRALSPAKFKETLLFSTESAFNHLDPRPLSQPRWFLSQPASRPPVGRGE